MERFKQFLMTHKDDEKPRIQEDGAGGGGGGGGDAGGGAACGSTGAGSIGSFASFLLGGTVIRRGGTMQKRIKQLSGGKVGITQRQGTGYHVYRVGESIEDITEDFHSVDKHTAQSAMSKVKDILHHAKTQDTDMVTYGLKDDKGQVITLDINREDAKDFEDKLNNLLYKDKQGDYDNENDESAEGLELGEVLFLMKKDGFSISNVKYDNLPKDEQQEDQVSAEQPEAAEGGAAEGGAAAGGEGEMSDEDLAAMGGEGGEGEMSDEDLAAMGGEGGEEGMGGEETGGGVESALQSVIDMLKADAEAKKAEANAKEAEARANEAKYAAQTAEHKIKQQEEIVDMEDFYARDKEKQKEADTLAKLAKYRYDKAKGMTAEGYRGTPELNDRDIPKARRIRDGKEEKIDRISFGNWLVSKKLRKRS